jgi:hypothetical protein
MTDEDMLDFLMTSEFENDISPDEFRILLNRWKYFYRQLYGKMERKTQDLYHELESATQNVASLEESVLSAQMDSAMKDDIIYSLKNRKLTFRERWTGKIIMKDENK